VAIPVYFGSHTYTQEYLRMLSRRQDSNRMNRHEHLFSICNGNKNWGSVLEDPLDRLVESQMLLAVVHQYNHENALSTVAVQYPEIGRLPIINKIIV
jgi:hypothetical protein